MPLDYTGQEASDQIKALIERDRPAMVARFGSNELECVKRFGSKGKRQGWATVREFLRERAHIFLGTSALGWRMENQAGFFPPETAYLRRFAEMMLEDVSELDILGSWLPTEKRLEAELKGVIKVALSDLEPYLHSAPWSVALKGKRVLVVHPYQKSIEAQYKKRSLLFKNKEVLPDFELLTLKAVQSIAGAKTEFLDWFAALDHMKSEIDRLDFDIALIGCGAYGFPLAAHVKRKGRIAVHLGGATQILFGIKGKRWDEWPSFRSLYNEHWVRPLPEETPQFNERVEGGAYW